MLERQLSSSGCSTSYAATSRMTRCHRTNRRGRGMHCRLVAQQLPYRTSQSPERDQPRRNGHPYRPLGSVKASAATATPPVSRLGEPQSVQPDLSISIPDAIPSFEELEGLRSRAMQSSQLRTNRRPDEDSPAGRSSRSVSTSSTSVTSGAPRIGQSPPDTYSERSPKGFVTRNDIPLVNSVMPPSLAVPNHPTLPQAVALPQPLSRPQPPLGGSAPAQGRKSALGPRRSYSPAFYRTMAFKSERNWRQLPGLLTELLSAGRLDAFTASAFLTHLAQLFAKSPAVSPAEVAIIERMQATLLDAIKLSMHEYRARQISNITWALARLGLPAGAAFVRECLLPASYPLLAWYEPQHLSNTLWALATTGVAPDDEWLEEYLTVAFIALQKRALAPQHLANVIWALERMGIMPDQEWMAAYYDCVQAAVPAANPQDCSNILSCLALMRMHHLQPSATSQLAGTLAQRLQALLTPEAAAASTGTAPRTPTTAAGVEEAAALTPIPAHSAGVGLPEPAGVAVDVSDQAIANSLWALAIMSVQPAEGLWDAVIIALRQRLADPMRLAPGMHPVALTIVLWASSSFGRPLPDSLTGLVYSRVRSAQMDAMEPRSLATMVWALGTAPGEQTRPPSDWVADVVIVSGRSVSQLGAQAVSNLLYGLCKLGARPPPAWMSAVINHFHRNLGPEASGQSLSNVLWCLAKMGYRLSEEGMDILFGLVRSQLAAWRQQCDGPGEQRQQQRGPRQQQEQGELQALLSPPPPFNSQEISNILYAIASMGYQINHSGELAQLLLEAARARLGEANAQELSNLMWCLAVVQIRPSQDWLDDYFTAAKIRLPTFKSFDLAQTLYGAAKLRLPSLSLTPTSGTANNREGESAAAPMASSAKVPATTTEAAGDWVSAALAMAPQLMPFANAQDLCNLSWALVQMRVPVQPDSALVKSFTLRLVALAGGCDPSQLALGVWALGKWRARPSKTQMERLEMATFRQVPSMRPHELAAMLSGFAGMGHAAPAEWLSDAVQQVAARSREFGPQEWTMVVYALARVQQNDNSLTEMVLRLLPRLDRLPLPSLILISYSCGCMGPSSMARQLVSRCLALLAAGAAPSRTPHAEDGAQRIGAPKGELKKKSSAGSGGRRGFGEAMHQRPTAMQSQQRGESRRGNGEALAVVLPKAEEADMTARPVAVGSLTLAELSAVLWSAVRVGIKVMPREFLEQFYSCTEPLLEGLPASLVASYLWAAGRLRLWLPTRWRKLLLERAEAQLPEMRARELAMCMAGLLWLRMWPTSSLLRKLRSCYENQRGEMPERVRKHADGALAVLDKRLALARERERKYGCSQATRLRWLVRVWRGNLRAAASGTSGFRGRGMAGAVPPGRVSRRQALCQGTVRRSPAGANKPSDKAPMPLAGDL